MTSPFIKAEQAYKAGFDFSTWGGIEGFLKASRTGAIGNHSALKRLVPDLAHAVDMTATAISSLPFDFLDGDGGVFDSSIDWQNNLGGLPNPQRLIYLLASSLCGGAAYLIPQRTPRMIFDLQYAAPHTIQPFITRDGLQYFDRASDQGKTDKYKPKELIYFWLPDSDIEIGPAENHPLGNAAMDALTVFNLKNTVSKYGERGFVPITVLGAKGMPNPAEREKAEGFFDKLLRGGFEVLAKIINADALSIQRVGAGMEELKQGYLELRRDSKESIGDAFGIPTALFMSDSAYASEMDILMRQWYSDSRFVSIYQTIEEVFSHQLLKPYGYKMQFALETLDIFQEDENQKAASLGTIVTAVTTDPKVAKLAMGILGYELTSEQESELDKLITEKDEEKKKIAEQMEQGKVDADGKPIPPQDETEEEEPQPFSNNGKHLDLSADELKDLALWYSKSKAWFLKNKGSAVDWENKHLREEIAAPIRLKLAEAKTEFDIMAAFRMDGANELNERESDIKALVAVIEKAIEATKGTQPPS